MTQTQHSWHQPQTGGSPFRNLGKRRREGPGIKGSGTSHALGTGTIP